jgi:hypothetical protein
MAFELVDGPSNGNWIARHTQADLGRVGAAVPDCYQRYVRLLHPARRRDGRAVTWEEVAIEKGRQVHPLVQWHALVGAPDPERVVSRHWSGTSPEVGQLSHELFGSLCRFLGEWTASACFFGIWDGWSASQSVAAPTKSGVNVLKHDDLASKDEKRAVKPDLRKLELPHRSYVLLRAKIETFSQEPDLIGPITPNMIWAESREWFVATEVDFDSTLIGGDREMTEAILGSSDFEAWEVSWRDSLTYRSDRVNFE